MRLKKRDQQDWHRADIIAELKKVNLTLAELSRMHGYHSGTLKNALYNPWPKGEQLIAKALKIAPEKIWPSRYKKITLKRRTTL